MLVTPTDGVHGSRRIAAPSFAARLARSNPQWESYPPKSEALAIFNGPNHYVTPAWYQLTKKHGKVVPTWNYSAVHVYGTLSFSTDWEWLLENVSDLTDRFEATVANPWRVQDAPEEFIDKMLGSIVGVELSVTRIEGKWKVSQNRSTDDRRGVI